MKRMALIAVLLFVWLTPPLNAQSRCLNRDGCAPLPCEFLAELMLTKLRVQAFAREEVQALGDTAFRVTLVRHSLTLKNLYPEYFSCSNSVSLLDLSLPTCTNLAAAGEAASRCREFGDALQMQQSACETQAAFSDPSPRYYQKSPAELSLDVEQAKLSSLKNSLFGYLASCTPDATLTMQLAQQGLSPLVNAAERARENWKAGRSGPSQSITYDPAGFSFEN